MLVQGDLKAISTKAEIKCVLLSNIFWQGKDVNKNISKVLETYTVNKLSVKGMQVSRECILFFIIT